MRLLGIIWWPLDAMMTVLLPRDGTRLAVIKLDKLGDFVLVLPYIHAQTPAPILIVTDYVAPFARVLCPQSPILPIQLKAFYWNPLYRIRCLYRMRHLRIGTIIHPTPSWFRFLWDVDPLIRASGAPQRIGFQSPEPIPWWAWLWATCWGGRYTNWVPVMGHEQLASLSLITNPIPNHLDGDNTNGPIVIAPLASALGKSWPFEWMKVVMDEIQSRGYSVVVVGLESDRSVLLQSGVPNEQLRLSPIGDASMMVDFLKTARCMVACDNGLAHLGGYLGVPTVVIAGAGQWGRFFPYHDEATRPLHTLGCEVGCKGCNWQCEYQVSGPTPCMAQISPSQVMDALNKWLGDPHD